MAEVSEKSNTATEQVLEKSKDVIETVKDAVANGAEKVTEVSSVAAEKASEVAANGSDKATEAAKDVVEKVKGEEDISDKLNGKHEDSRKRRGSFNSDRRGDKKFRGGDRNGNSNNYRGRGDGQRGGYNNNKNRKARSRFEDQPESNDAGEIRRQVEFYFSDSNLPIDKYLLELTGGKENKPVKLKTIHDFKRMRHFQPYSAVRDAVAASDFLELSADDEITRKVPLADKYTSNADENKAIAQTTMMARSAYVKGFPEEHERTHLDIEEFLAPYGPIQSVRLRRHDDGEFKGSIFVEFGSEELLKAFLELDPAPEFDGKALQIMSKQQYVDKKTEGIHEGSVKPRSPRREFTRKFDGDKDDWKNRRDHDRRHGGNDRGRGGQRGRGGRGGRGGGGRDRDGGERRNYRDVEKDGEPKGAGELLSRAEAEAKREKEGEDKGEAKTEATENRTETAGTKRAHDGEGEQSEAKKVKEGETTA